MSQIPHRLINPVSAENRPLNLLKKIFQKTKKLFNSLTDWIADHPAKFIAILAGLACASWMTAGVILAPVVFIGVGAGFVSFFLMAAVIAVAATNKLIEAWKNIYSISALLVIGTILGATVPFVSTGIFVASIGMAIGACVGIITQCLIVLGKVIKNRYDNAKDKRELLAESKTNPIWQEHLKEQKEFAAGPRSPSSSAIVMSRVEISESKSENKEDYVLSEGEVTREKFYALKSILNNLVGETNSSIDTHGLNVAKIEEYKSPSPSP